MKNLTGIIIVLLLVGGALFAGHRLFSSDTDQDPALTPASRQSVSVVHPEHKTKKDTVKVSGVVVPRQDIAVTSDIVGARVLQVSGEEGQTVRTGAVLATLDDAALKTQATDLQKQASDAQSAYERANAIKDSGAISLDVIAEKKSAYALLSAQLNDVSLKQKQTTVTAPADGLIYERRIQVGAVTGSDPLFRIARDGRLELEAQAPESDIAQISVGQKATVVIGQKNIQGTVRLVAPEIDSTTHVAKLRIAFPPGLSVPIGAYGTAEIAVPGRGGLSLPQSAVLMDDNQSYVWTVNPDGAVARLEISVDSRQSGLVFVHGPGVTEQTAVVAKAGAFMKNGDIVSIASQPAALTTIDGPAP